MGSTEMSFGCLLDAFWMPLGTLRTYSTDMYPPNMLRSPNMTTPYSQKRQLLRMHTLNAAERQPNEQGSRTSNAVMADRREQLGEIITGLEASRDAGRSILIE